MAHTQYRYDFQLGLLSGLHCERYVGAQLQYAFREPFACLLNSFRLTMFHLEWPMDCRSTIVAFQNDF